MSTNTPTPDVIRIVPLREHVAAAPTGAPQLTYRGGPLLTQVAVATTYWGSAWKSAQLAAVATRLDSFFSYVVTSPLIDQLAEYSTGGHRIGLGSYAGSSVLDTDPPSTVQDSAIQQMLQDRLNSGALPAPTPNTLYFTYLPPGVTVDMGGQSSCSAFCGYHDSFGANIFYAVMPYPDCAGCTGSLSAEAALTVTSSHELCEAITDPVPGQGWYDDTNGEIGDICAWQTKQLDAYEVQLEWSNAHNACV